MQSQQQQQQQQQQVFFQQQDNYYQPQQEQIVFCYDNTEQTYDINLFAESSMVQETVNSQKMQMFQQQNQISQPIKIQLPKWINNEVFTVFHDYIINKNLINWADKSLQLSDITLQRLLWTGDYFQMEGFQQLCIKDVLIPRIRVNNCMLFLNEAFKKLKACEDSCDIWYMLLNTGMNFTSKNLLTIYRNNPADLIKINNKILDEIIERAFKNFKRKHSSSTFDPKELIEVILYIRNLSNPFDLLTFQRKNILTRKINYSNHPSISWKLSNISSIENKETNPFKFNDSQWKLQAKMENVNSSGGAKALRIYLKIVQSSASSSSSQSATSKNGSSVVGNSNQLAVTASAASTNSEVTDPTEFKKIMSLYFLLKLNDKEVENALTIKHIIFERQEQILLCEFEGAQLREFENKKLEFTVYLNTDYIYSLILNHVSKSLDTATMNPNFEVLSEDDVVAVLKSLPHVQATQEKSLSISLIILQQEKHPITNIPNMLKAIEFSVVSSPFLMHYQTQLLELLNSTNRDQMFKRNLSELKRIIDLEIAKKLNKTTSHHTPSKPPSMTNLDSNLSNMFEMVVDTHVNFRQYMQRNNDHSEVRKKMQSSDQFLLRKTTSEDSSVSSISQGQQSQGQLNNSNLSQQPPLLPYSLNSNKPEKTKRSAPFTTMSANKSASMSSSSSSSNIQLNPSVNTFSNNNNNNNWTNSLQEELGLFSKQPSNTSDQHAYFLGSDVKLQQQISSNSSLGGTAHGDRNTNNSNNGNSRIQLVNSSSISNPNSINSSQYSQAGTQKLFTPANSGNATNNFNNSNNYHQFQQQQQQQFLKSPQQQPSQQQQQQQQPNLATSQGYSPPRSGSTKQIPNGPVPIQQGKQVTSQNGQGQQTQLLPSGSARPPLRQLQQQQQQPFQQQHQILHSGNGVGSQSIQSNGIQSVDSVEREKRKAALLQEIDLKNYVLNKNILQEFSSQESLHLYS